MRVHHAGKSYPPANQGNPDSSLILDLGQGPDHPTGNALAFLVTVGDQEANKKLNSFRVASGDLGLEAVLLRLGLATIC